MSIRIVTDSGADLEREEYQQCDVELIPLGLTIDGRIYRADEKFNKTDFFRLLEAAKVFPKTSQPAPAEFEQLFEAAKQAGDQVVYISIASALSGTFQTASVVKTMGSTRMCGSWTAGLQRWDKSSWSWRQYGSGHRGKLRRRSQKRWSAFAAESGSMRGSIHWSTLEKADALAVRRRGLVRWPGSSRW